MILFSVIIPSYNSCATLARTVEALLLQRTDFSHEIIIADSSDDARTRPLLESFPEGRVRLVSLPPKTMPALARNAGAAAAQGEILVFVDSDAYPAADWLEKIWKACREGKKLGGGSILLPPFQRRTPLAVAQYYLQFNEFMDTGAPRPKKFVPSCNLFCAKEVFAAAGGFPAIRASEDVLFCLKAGESAACWFLPEARVFHIFREEMGPFLRNQRLLGKYVCIYRRRTQNPAYLRGLAPLFLLPFILAAKFLRMTARSCAKPSSIPGYLYSFWAFALGFLFWGKGFTEGIFSKE